MICTTYYANLKKLPSSITPVAISSTVPKGMSILWIPEVAPPYNMRTHYKQAGDRDLFREQYFSWLERIDLRTLIAALPEGDVALVCYEKDTNTCHRSLLAEYLCERLGLQVKEWGCVE